MPNVSDLIADYRVHAKLCPDPTFKRALGEVVKEFCRNSWYYQKTLTLSSVATQDVYALDLDSDDQIIAVQAVQYGNTPLRGIRQQDYLSSSGTPKWFQYEPPYFVLINPAPTTDGTNDLKIRLVLQRDEDSTTVPEEIYRAHSETLKAGVLSYIFSLPEELWTDFGLAAVHEKRFQAGIQEAKRMRHRGFVSGSIQMRPRSIL